MQEDLHDLNFANSGNSAQNSGNIDHVSQLGNDSSPVLSQELKKLRLRISDYNKSPIVDAVCQKVSYLTLINLRFGVLWFKSSTTRTCLNLFCTNQRYL